MRGLLNEVSGVDTNHLDSKTFAGSNTHVKIFFNLIDIHVLLSVQGSGIKAVWGNGHDQFTKSESIIKDMEKSVIGKIHWNLILAVLVFSKDVVDHFGECGSLFNGVGVLSTMYVFNLSNGSKFTFNNISELITRFSFHANHHCYELRPLEDTVLVVILLSKHLGNISIRDLSVS